MSYYFSETLSVPFDDTEGCAGIPPFVRIGDTYDA